MKILKSSLCGVASVIGAFATFAVMVWLYSGLKLGFSSGVQYDARAIAAGFPFVALLAVGIIFILGFLGKYRQQ